MDLELTDKVAVVTGANKGIGLAVTRALLAEGAYVVAGSRTTDNLDVLDRVTAVPVDLTRAALDPMLKQGSGSIVNVASVNAFFQPDAATIDYGAAKAAVVNLSKSLAQEFGHQGIRVNCVSPGQVGTDLWLGEHGVAQTIGKAAGIDPNTVLETAVAGIATGRFTTPEEVATLVTMLASERTANVTGANYVIDGGLIKTT
jgi:NAD(P)-dependent dehydrogenase (short-subunit alcohol dehydrogenase family)